MGKRCWGARLALQELNISTNWTAAEAILSIYRYAATSSNSPFHSFKHFTVKLPQWSQVCTLQRMGFLIKRGCLSSTNAFATIKEKSKSVYTVLLKGMCHRPSLKLKSLKKIKHSGILFMIWTKTVYTRIYNTKYSNLSVVYVCNIKRSTEAMN